MLTNTTNVKRYAIVGDPVATYDFDFPFWSKSEIKVYLTLSDGTLTELVEETDYTLSSPSDTGTVTRVGTWEGGTHLTIVREIPHTQNVDLRNGDRIDAETIEESLDNLTAQIQQVSESLSRTVITSIDEVGGDIVIPNRTQRQGSGEGTIMGFGADGDSVVLRDLKQFDLDVASAASNAQSASDYASVAGGHSADANQSKLDAQDEADRAKREADKAEGIISQGEADIDEYVTTTVEPGINTFAQTTSRAVVEAYVESTAKAELDAYTTTKEGEITTHTEGKKGELDTYVNNTSKPSIADYVDDTSKPDLSAFMNALKQEWKSDLTSLPVGTIIAYAGTDTPNGWFDCIGTAISRETYARLYELIGTTYGAGDGSTTFNLPDLRGRFLEGGESAGAVKEAGLPNITGKTTNFFGNSGGHGAVGEEAEGAFKTEKTSGTQYLQTTSYSSSNFFLKDNFDASRSSDVYGNSDTVQPASIVFRYIIKAFDIVTDPTPVSNLQSQISVMANRLQLMGEIVYPVGAIYISVEDVSPASFIGGTWTKLDEGYALWTASSGASEKISAGLPNIIANMGNVFDAWSGVNNFSGAAYSGGSSGHTFGSSGTGLSKLRFEASRGETDINGTLKTDASTKVYGKSETVQPPAYKVYAWRRTA